MTAPTDGNVCLAEMQCDMASQTIFSFSIFAVLPTDKACDYQEVRCANMVRGNPKRLPCRFREWTQTKVPVPSIPVDVRFSQPETSP